MVSWSCYACGVVGFEYKQKKKTGFEVGVRGFDECIVCWFFWINYVKRFKLYQDSWINICLCDIYI